MGVLHPNGPDTIGIKKEWEKVDTSRVEQAQKILKSLENEKNEQSHAQAQEVEDLKRMLDEEEASLEMKLQNICHEPIKWVDEMAVKSFDWAKETFWLDANTIKHLDQITETDKYKERERKGFILDQWTERWWTKGFHVGVDYQIEAGKEVNAIYAGEVVQVITPEIEEQNRKELWINKGSEARGYWNMLLLKHTLDDGTHFYSIYGHIAPEKSFKVWDIIDSGEKIWTVWRAFTKENGNFPAHLHFAILKNLDNEENIGGYTQNKETLNNTIDPLTVQFINN